MGTHESTTFVGPVSGGGGARLHLGDIHVRIVPFEPWHLGLVDAAVFDRSVANLIDLRALASATHYNDPAFSVIHEGCVVGAVGILVLWPRVAEGWLFASDELRRHPVFLHKYVKRGIVMLEQSFGLHRIQISVHAGYVTAQRWAERLGFAFEGEMKGYGPNGDTYLRYARVKNV